VERRRGGMRRSKRHRPLSLTRPARQGRSLPSASAPAAAQQLQGAQLPVQSLGTKLWPRC